MMLIIMPVITAMVAGKPVLRSSIGESYAVVFQCMMAGFWVFAVLPFGLPSRAPASRDCMKDFKVKKSHAFETAVTGQVRYYSGPLAREKVRSNRAGRA